MGVIRLMKYKVGDKVRIKTIEEIRDIKGHFYDFYPQSLIDFLIKNNYILTIKEIDTIGEGYRAKEDYIKGVWKEYAIKGLYKEPVYKPILNRWELLDL